MSELDKCMDKDIFACSCEEVAGDGKFCHQHKKGDEVENDDRNQQKIKDR